MAPRDGAERPATAFATEPGELDAIVEEAVEFVAERVGATGRDGVVVEISGGLDSAVATMLAVDALDADAVFGLLLPAYLHTAADALTAELVAEGLGIEYAEVQLLPFVHLFSELSVPGEEGPRDVDATTDAIDRMRMACAYYVADTMDRLVLGTENRTDRLLGATTKYGVRRGDLLPLGDLYRTEVENVAEHIGIPRGAYESEEVQAHSSTALELDVDLSTVDEMLHRLVDEDEEIDRIAAELGVEREAVQTVAERHVRTRHQRTPPPTPRTAPSGRYDNFHEIELRFD